MSGSERTPSAEILREQLHAFATAPSLAGASDDELLAHTAELEALGRVIDAARVAVAGEIAHRSRPQVAPDTLSGRRGCRDAAELLERVTQVSAATARTRMKTAKPLRPRIGLTGEEVAAQLQKLLDAILNPRVSAPGPRFEPLDEPVDPDEPVDRRTQPQCRHDALAGILTIAAGVERMPLLGGSAPTLVVTVAADQLDRPDGVAFLPADRAGETGATGAAIARHVGCAGQVQRLVTDRSGRIIELGSPQRIFAAHQRRAIAARDGGCLITGCHTPAAWCEVHHVEPAARGGPTHTDNGVLLCWFHHRTIDSGGWEIRMVHGVPWARAPRWLDVSGRWRPAANSPARRLQALGAPRPC